METTLDNSGQLKAKYLRGVVVDEIINGFEADALGKLHNRSFHHDQVNSVTALTDHTGSVVHNTTYSPFGRLLSESGTSPNKLKYTGRAHDSDTGLYYYRARYYDPEIGRFLSEDPIGLDGGINFYAYVNNNPINYNDPAGQLALPWHFGITYSAARDSGRSFTESINIAWEATAADFGTQSAYWYDTRQHGMVGLTPVGSWDEVSITYIQQTPEQAFTATNQFIDYNFSLGTAQGDGRALHALQDLETPLHQGQVWNPSWSWENAVHIFEDVFPSSEVVTNAYNSSLDALGGPALQQSSSINGAGSYWGGLGDMSGFNASSANGGFVLYPNKINSNISTGVYSK